MDKALLAGCGVWAYAGWVGYEEFVRNAADWRLGLLSLLNCCLFFGYQLADRLQQRVPGRVARAMLLLVAVGDVGVLGLTQAWMLQSNHTFVSALGPLAGTVNIFVYIGKMTLISALVLLLLLSGVIKWADSRERSSLRRLLENMYADKGRRPGLVFSRRELRAFFRECGAGLGALPILEAEKQIIMREYTRLANDEDAETDCAICLSPFSLADLVCQIACIHKFHPECVLQWFREKPHCPLCRKPFRFSLLRTLFRPAPRKSR